MISGVSCSVMYFTPSLEKYRVRTKRSSTPRPSPRKGRVMMIAVLSFMPARSTTPPDAAMLMRMGKSPRCAMNTRLISGCRQSPRVKVMKTSMRMSPRKMSRVGVFVFASLASSAAFGVRTTASKNSLLFEKSSTALFQASDMRSSATLISASFARSGFDIESLNFARLGASRMMAQLWAFMLWMSVLSAFHSMSPPMTDGW
mmetsp:Transcript_95541/g.270095  ORF Transcript_95541/g.270095 Transcript_95541/m.270095 type:complete len:202 (+) Transcript_95541:1956-2561(+)